MQEVERMKAIKKQGEEQQAKLFFKTQICPNFEWGQCFWGEKCHYAHGEHELQIRPNLEKTKICNSVDQGMPCLNPRCGFAHHPSELRHTNNLYKTSLCIENQKGFCKKGDLCWYAHGQQELRTKEDNIKSNQRPSQSYSAQQNQQIPQHYTKPQMMPNQYQNMSQDPQQYMNFIPMNFQPHIPFQNTASPMNNIPMPGMYSASLPIMNPSQFQGQYVQPNFLPPNMINGHSMAMPIIPPYIQQPTLVQNKPQIPNNNKQQEKLVFWDQVLRPDQSDQKSVSQNETHSKSDQKQVGPFQYDFLSIQNGHSKQQPSKEESQASKTDSSDNRSVNSNIEGSFSD